MKSANGWHDSTSLPDADILQDIAQLAQHDTRMHATPSVVAVEMHAKPPGNFSRRMALKRNTQIEEEQDVRRETPEDIEPRPAKTRTPNNRESCRAPANYDETKRKRPQKRKANDIRRIDGSTRKDTKIARIGPRVIERTVDDRYEWRDGNLREKEPGIS